MIVTEVLDAIRAVSRSAPDDAAVQDPHWDLTYAGLESETVRVASGLVASGARPGDRVALHLSNSADYVIAALASLWIGAIFVPLAVTDPDARLAGVLSDCSPVLVVTADSAADPPAPAALFGVPTATVRQLRDAGTAKDAARVHGKEAYAIYTSGTTGVPKGVLIGNHAFAVAAAAGSTAMGLNAETRVLCVSPFHFDGSFGGLFLTLYRGGSVVIRPRDALLFPRTFFNTIANEAITYTSFSPSYLRLLLASKQMAKLVETGLTTMALGGEALSAGDLQATWDAVPKLRIYNRYGPTETTIAVTSTELTRDLIADGTVPIGRPHPATEFHLVDEGGRLINEARSVGELYISGEQLMTGYWGAPGLSHEVLRTDIIRGETLYRTGDLAYRTEAGDFVYVDRADRIVKRNGIRISLLEVAVAFRQLPGVTAATSATYDDEGQLAIATFVVSETPRTEFELQTAALELLPETMLPNRIFIVPEFPLAGSSKLSEQALLAQVGLQPRNVERDPMTG